MMGYLKAEENETAREKIWEQAANATTAIHQAFESQAGKRGSTAAIRIHASKVFNSEKLEVCI
jgi:hypothetical protein